MIKKAIIILFFAFTILILYGFYIKEGDFQRGNLYIGLGIAGGVFLVMPLFLYHRWKHRDVKDYMLTKDSFKKMREYESLKDKERRENNKLKNKNP